MSAREFSDECIVREHLDLSPDGQPHLKLPAGGKSVDQTAARTVYRIFVGHLTNGQVVSLRCGNVACLNPNHLYVRSRSEASADKPRRILFAEDYWYIRRSPLSIKQMAAKLGYSSGGISDIRKGVRGPIEHFSLRYAVLVFWERLTRQGRRQTSRGAS